MLKFDSRFDASQNYVKDFGKSYIESRYVSRTEDQNIVYVSSHNGCNMACRFCHLTQTKQVEMEPVPVANLCNQIDTVLRNAPRKDYLNVNFMARGEPLENSIIGEDFTNTIYFTDNIIDSYGYNLSRVKYNISSIIPRGYKHHFREVMPKRTYLYWSLYSLDRKFRRRWLPKSENPYDALELFQGFDRVVIHMAFIEDQNDDTQTISDLVDFVGTYFEYPRMNIVRYNPFSEKFGNESPKINDISEEFSSVAKVQIVPRVGPDIWASCGTFYN